MSEGLLGTTTEVKPPPFRRYVVLCSISLIVLGLFFIIYGSIDYRIERTETKVLDRIGVVVDAGGSGTRMLIYRYANGTMTQLKYSICEGAGLSNYNESEFHKLKKLLIDCLDKGAASVHKITTGYKKVPIYFAATGGMRLLKLSNAIGYSKIWTLVKECLDESEFRIAKADTITGLEEAKWAWVAANYLKRTFKGSSGTYGSIDFGSSSLQLAFEPKGDVNPSVDIATLDIDGHHINLYGHSYLCYGSNEMLRRFLAKIVKNAGYSSVVENPCYFEGYSRNVSSEYLWKEPCSSGNYAKNYLGEDIRGPSGKTFTIEGSSNFSQCYRLLHDVIHNNCTNKHGLCGMNNEYQPKLSGNFFGLSSFYYIQKTLDLAPNSGKDSFYQSARKLCSKTWDDMTKGKSSTKYIDAKCFQAAYGFYLLADGFKFDKSTWNIEYTKKIDGSDVGWSLGLIYASKDDMYPTKLQRVKAIIENPALLALIILGPICIIVGILLIFKVCRVKAERGDDDTDDV